MSLGEALEILECISNLDDSARLSYLCKQHIKIGDAAGVGVEAIKELKRINKLLECWEEMNDGR